MRPHPARRLVIQLGLAVVLAALLVLPDHLYRLAHATYQARFNGGVFAVLGLLGFLILGLRRAWAAAALLVFFATLQLSQFLHFTYFGTLVSPHEVVFLFREWDEIWLTLQAILPYVAYPLVIVLACAGAAWWLWRASRPHVLALPIVAPVLLLLLLAILPWRAYHGAHSQAFYPNPKAYSIQNTLYAASYFVGTALRPEAAVAGPDFQPYRVERVSTATPPTIVLVMGESLSHSHMSLFGYGRETTPRLDALRDDPAFVAHKAVAGGISTKVSLPTFFNIQREPGHIEHLMRYGSNLFKLAKESGLATHFISAQTANLATYSGSEFADQFVTVEEMGDLYEQKKDGVLLHYLERMDLTRPGFIVLHQRNSHGPYEKSSLREFDAWPVPADADRHTYTVNTYDNSIRYTDYLLDTLIKDLRTRTRGPVYLFMTADHAEMMGEGGKYGHNMLEPDVVRVPFLFYAIRGDAKVVERIRAMQAPTHYDIGLEIARLLGYRIDNPNATPGRYYVNGLDLAARLGCFALDKDPAAPEGWKVAGDPLCGGK